MSHTLAVSGLQDASAFPNLSFFTVYILQSMKLA